MDIKQQVKTTVKNTRNRYIEYRRKQTDLKTVKKLLQGSEEPIPELTAQQKRDIKSYWAVYEIDVPLEWHQLLYGKTGIIHPNFIPEPIFHRVVKPCMNDYTFAGIWSDKSYIDFFIQSSRTGVKTARNVVRNVNGRFLDENFYLISMGEAEKILAQYSSLVIKPATYTDTGRGVRLLRKPYDLQKMNAEYRKNYVIQIPLHQNSEIAKLNPSSVNTIRINSVLLEKDARVMSAFIKVGQAGEFADNHGHDRYFIGVNEDGTYRNYAINHDLKKFDSIPSKYEFAGKPVPGYDKVCRAIEAAHACIPHFGFAFWDVCVDTEGEPVIVEVNLRYPDTVISQAAAGPFLGKDTEEILKFAFSKK